MVVLNVEENRALTFLEEIKNLTKSKALVNYLKTTTIDI